MNRALKRFFEIESNLKKVQQQWCVCWRCPCSSQVLASGLEIWSVSSSSLNFRPIGSRVQADMDVFGMDALDIAAHGAADPLTAWHDCTHCWNSKHGATYCVWISDPEHFSAFAKHYLQLPHGLYFNSDRSMAKDIDRSVWATFFQNSSLYHMKIPPGMFNVYVRSFSVPAHE